MEFISYKKITKDQSRDTGMAMVLLLLIADLYAGRRGLILAAGFLQVVTMTLPQVFRPIAVVWFGLSKVLGEVASRILLSIVYFGVLTPIGLLRRLGGKDPLLLRSFKASDASVMIQRDHKFSGQDIVRPY